MCCTSMLKIKAVRLELESAERPLPPIAAHQHLTFSLSAEGRVKPFTLICIAFP